MVQCAAVVSDLVPDRLLRHVSGLPDEAFDAAVRDAVADGVLRPDGAGYRFAHDLVRSAVSADLLPGERARLHGRVADASRAGLPARCARRRSHTTSPRPRTRGGCWPGRCARATRRCGSGRRTRRCSHFDRALSAWPEVDAGRRGRRVVARAGSRSGPPARPVSPVSRRGRPSWRAWRSGCVTQEGDGPGSVQARASLVRLLVAADAAGQAVGPAEEAVRLAESPDVDAVSSALAHVVLARALLGGPSPGRGA